MGSAFLGPVLDVADFCSLVEEDRFYSLFPLAVARPRSHAADFC